MADRAPDQFARSVLHLASMDNETPWLEVKVNNDNPEKIGQNISAIANSVAIAGRNRGYILWGIHDSDHRLVGTTFEFFKTKQGNEELNNWLHHNLSPHVAFRVQEGFVNGERIVMMEIPPAVHDVVRFKGLAYIRSGSYTKPLSAFREKEHELFARLRSMTFEREIAKAGASADEVLALLDAEVVYDLTKQPRPADPAAVIERLMDWKFVMSRSDGDFDITNLGAVALAKRLADFGLERKGLRIVVYSGRDRLGWISEVLGERGYASGFRQMLRHIVLALPARQQIIRGVRTDVSVLPEDAIRELLANALIHQDFSVTGAGPMVEVYSDRVEVTNPGAPLVDPDRFIDKRKSRNEQLALAMRHLRLCEERGSGIDRVIRLVEDLQLPAPSFRRDADQTEVTLFYPKKWEEMSAEDKIRACYQHAAIQFEKKDFLTNTSLRGRFALGQEKSSAVSKIIADALRLNRIVKTDEEGGRRHARYQPYYAREFLSYFPDGTNSEGSDG